MFTSYDIESGLHREIYQPEQLSKMVLDTTSFYKDRYESLLKENKQLREKGKEMADETLKSQIASLKERLSFSYGEFSSQKEKDAYDDFTERHMHQRMTLRAQGGKAPYLIPTGTGIGTILYVKCPICGEEENITDMEVW